MAPNPERSTNFWSAGKIAEHRGPPGGAKRGIAKAPTGCKGLDEITEGGLPAGRPTLVCGGPGCGKTVLGMEFLVRGARELDEPGLFVSFDESRSNLIENFAPLGLGIEDLLERKKLEITHIDVSPGEAIQTGDFSLDALLLRLNRAVDELGAQRIVLDSMESIFSVLADSVSLRREITRLFHWLREKGLTTVVTAERGTETFTRNGFEEYVSDCVLLLDHRITDHVSKRRIRVLKYRGSSHGKDEYPFLIGKRGLSVIPITSAQLDHDVGTERIATGIDDLDEMLEGEGYFEGSTVLVSGRAGTGKSSLSASFAAAACARGERCVYFASEESVAQLSRNMRSIGVDLERWSDAGLLEIVAYRPSVSGLEEHLVGMIDAIERIRPSCTVLDPITNFITVGSRHLVKGMLTRFIDYMKKRNITNLLTALTEDSEGSETTPAKVSSMADTWITLETEIADRTRRRGLQIVKSRGMDHSLEMRELIMSSRGLSLTRMPPLGGDPAPASGREPA